MTWTTSQLQTIKAAINGNATALAAWNAGNPGGVAALLNAPSSPAVSLVRTDVTARELFHALVASEVLALTQAQQLLLQMAGLAGSIDFTNPNVAGGLTSVFPSTTQTYANIMAVAKRTASALEAIFTNTTTGVCSVFGATATEADVRAAMAS